MYLCVSREIKQEIEEEGFTCLTNYPFLFLPHHLDHLEATKSARNVAINKSDCLLL